VSRPIANAFEYHDHELRGEAAPVITTVPLLFSGLALVSWIQDWEFVGFRWWAWLGLTAPALVLALDLWLGPRGFGFARTRSAGLVLLGMLIVGNLVGLLVLVTVLITARSTDLDGLQLLLPAGAIWVSNVVVFGMCFWELDGGGPTHRPRGSQPPDFQFPQQKTSGVAPDGWRPRIWDYLYTSLSTATAFSATDTMPLTLRAKALMGIEAVLCLVLVTLVTARAVNVLGA
jgi:hypothetical protein